MRMSAAGPRHRDLFALPRFAPRLPLPLGASVSQRRRVAAHRRDEARANEIIDTLNEMAGSSDQGGGINAGHLQARAAVLSQVKLGTSVCSDVHGRAAVRELLAGDLPYGGGEATCTVKPYQRELVSLPVAGLSGPMLEDAVDERGKEVLTNFATAMLLDEAEWGRKTEEATAVTPYMDVTLAGNLALYQDFIVQLWDSGMLSATLDP